MERTEPMNRKAPERLLHEEVTRAILGAFYAVYSEVGYGSPNTSINCVTT